MNIKNFDKYCKYHTKGKTDCKECGSYHFKINPPHNEKRFSNN